MPDEAAVDPAVLGRSEVSVGPAASGAGGLRTWILRMGVGRCKSAVRIWLRPERGKRRLGLPPPGLLSFEARPSYPARGVSSTARKPRARKRTVTPGVLDPPGGARVDSMEQAKQLMAAAEAASDHITLLRNTLMEMRATWANQVGADPSEWEQEFPRLAERVRAALGEQPGSPIEMPDEDGDDLPGYEFRVKDPDFLSEMVESAGLSTAAYLEYGE